MMTAQRLPDLLENLFESLTGAPRPWAKKKRAMLAVAPRARGPSRVRLLGTVNEVANDGRSGFICDENGVRYFFHQRAVLEDKLVEVGSRVSFEIGPGRSKPCASTVIVLGSRISGVVEHYDATQYGFIRLRTRMGDTISVYVHNSDVRSTIHPHERVSFVIEANATSFIARDVRKADTLLSWDRNALSTTCECLRTPSLPRRIRDRRSKTLRITVLYKPGRLAS